MIAMCPQTSSVVDLVITSIVEVCSLLLADETNTLHIAVQSALVSRVLSLRHSVSAGLPRPASRSPSTVQLNSCEKLFSRKMQQEFWLENSQDNNESKRTTKKEELSVDMF